MPASVNNNNKKKNRRRKRVSSFKVKNAQSIMKDRRRRRNNNRGVNGGRSKRYRVKATPPLPMYRQHPSLPSNIFVNYDKNVLDKRMLLEQHIAEGNISDDEIDNLRGSSDDEDGLGTDVFKKYIDAVGGPLFKAECELLKKKENQYRLSNESRRLNEQRIKEALQCKLDIGPIKVTRNEFPKHNNYDNIPSHPFRTLFTGTTGSGKTTNMINLLIKPEFLKDYFDTIYIFSPNCRTEIEFDEIQKQNRGDVICSEHFDEAEVTEIFHKLIKTAKKHKNDRSMMPRVLLFIDDFAGHKEVMNSQLLVKIFFMSRKYSTSTWISSQRYKAVPSNLRTNSEFHVIYEQSSTQTMLIAEELSVGAFTKHHIVNAMNDVSSKRFNFLFINTRKPVSEGRFRLTYSEKLIPTHNSFEEEEEEHEQGIQKERSSSSTNPTSSEE